MRIPLNHIYTAKEIQNLTQGNGAAEGHASHLTTDSREVEAGDLFVALRGENSDGHAYIQDALDRGAALILCEKAPPAYCDISISVDNTYIALKSMASAARKKIAPTVIAITGSVGKTTTKNMMAAVLGTHFRVHKTPGNFNNLLGVCLTLLSMPQDTEVLVCELGMNHAREIGELSRLVLPDIAVITNVGTAHIGNLGSRANIAAAKLEILEGCAPGALYLYSQNEPLLMPPASADVVTMRIGRQEGCHCYSQNTAVSHGFVCADYICNTTQYTALRLPGISEHLTQSAAFSIAVAHVLGLSEGKIRRGLLTWPANEWRGQPIKAGDITIIADCYNASPESAKTALISLAQAAEEAGGRKIALLGDMLELGAESRILHEEVGIACHRAGIDLLFTFGAAAESIANGAIRAGIPADRIFRNPNPSAHEVSVAQLQEQLRPRDVLLVKASRALTAEKIVLQLAELLNR